MDPKTDKTVLKNGVRVVSRKIPHSRSVSMGVWVNVGSRDETPDQCGLSHFIEHMIFKGTERRTAFQIAKEFDAIGGQTNAFTTMEATCYHARVLDSHLEKMFDILSDIFLNSSFKAEEVERERQVISQEINMLEDNPDEYVHHLASCGYWKDNPLGRSILGTPENIQRFTAESIRDFFQHFYQPERIVVSLAGNVDHQRLVDLVSPGFDAITSGNDFPVRVAPERHPGVSVVQRKLEQAHLCLAGWGISVTDQRRFALSLTNTIIGGNMSSRLFQEIREKRGLAYSVYSFVSSYVDTGMFGVYAGVDPNNVLRTSELILETFEHLGHQKVSDDELRDAKEFTKGSLLLASESIDNQMVRLAQNEIHFGEFIPLEKVVEKIESVSSDDITELAELLADRQAMSLTLLGPASDSKMLDNLISG